MKKVRFLLAVSALLVLGCRHNDGDDHHYPPDSPSFLDVIVNGPCMLVWIPSRPDVITLISPRDAEGLHKVYLNSLIEGTDQDVHIALASDGLEHGTKLPELPYFPPDFIAKSIQWVPQKDYLMAIELPLPEKISFVSPLHPVTFEKNHIQSFQATNFVLEYKVKDFSKIHTAPRQPNSTSALNSVGPLNNVRPLSSSALLEQYAALCGKADVRQHYYESCSDIRNLLEQCAGARTKVLFFGIGIPLDKEIKMLPGKADAHAVNFFNLMLQSFPDLIDQKRLAPKDEVGPKGSGRPNAMLMEASFSPMPHAHPVPMNAFYTAVIDCKAGNIIVTAQTIKQ